MGAHVVSPKSDNGKHATGDIYDVHSDSKPTLTMEYFIADNLGIEVLAALPFDHDAGLRGAPGNVVTTKLLPPTLSGIYHFNFGSPIVPFFGVGVNYTTFWSTTGPGWTSLSDSWGVAVNLGTDIALNEQTSFRVNARWIDVSTDLKVDGAKVGTVELDPIVVGFSFVHKF